MTAAHLAETEAEILCSIAGTDDVSYQPVLARHTYEHRSVLWGYRHVDILTETPDGSLLLDVSRFHDVEPA
jgi:inward rectifier potassium channel